MSTTELDAVEALLERVLPDPRAFAERAFQQAMARLTSEPPGAEPPATVVAADANAREGLFDRNVLLAAAVGACECWGDEPDCPVCSGRGRAGWVMPDARLFAEFVEPAVVRRSENGAARSFPPEPAMQGGTG